MSRWPLATFDDRRTLRYVRVYPHPIERVWSAVTEPAQLDAWMMPSCQIEPGLGGAWRFSFSNPDPADDVVGTITAWEPPRLVHYGVTGNFGAMRFELEAVEGGTQLTFIHAFPAHYRGKVRDTPGGDFPAGLGTPWQPDFVHGFHLMLDRMEDYLAGRPMTDDPDGPALMAAYRTHIRDNITAEPT
jgi:uncharacterized protein YndB with AHSA1/START domain